MAADEPPYLTVGTDVSAKYKGAFCEAKIKKVNRMVKCKVTFKNNLGSALVPDDQVKGSLRIGADVEAKHPEKNQFLDAIINKLQDYSQYTVVFDDGDETTLRRTSLCLKSGRHFAESPTLDQFPLTNPEHFGTPVIGTSKSKRKRRSTMNSASLDYDSSDEELNIKKTKVSRGKERDPDLGKVVCVDLGDRRKKDNWYPGLVVTSPDQDISLNPKEEYLIRSFKDGKYYQVFKKDTREFTREIGQKVDNNTLKTAVEKAMLYYEKEELPPHWDKALYVRVEMPFAEEESHDSDSDTSDDEPSEEKDRFVAQLYKFMDERGTPINKAPTVGNRDLNLYKLFKIMYKMGGYNRVTNQNQWKLVYSKMGLPPSNPAGSNQIKLAYKRYLHSFEDFYRKLGCTMVTNSRSTRVRHRSDRNFIITRNRDRDMSSTSTKAKISNKEKFLGDKKSEEGRKPDSKTKSEEASKQEEKQKPDKKKNDKTTKIEEKEEKGRNKKEDEKPRLVRSQSLNKDKKEGKEKEEDKKESKPEKARTREDARKEKTESPEKKETRSSVKIELEREKREKEEVEKKEADQIKEKKERLKDKEVKADKLVKKEEKETKDSKDKKEEKSPRDKKVEKFVKDKRLEKTSLKDKKEEKPAKDKKEEKSPVKEKKDDKLVKDKKEDKLEEKNTKNKKEEKLVKDKKEEKFTKLKKDDKPIEIEMKSKEKDVKLVKEKKETKQFKDNKKEDKLSNEDVVIKKEDSPLKEKKEVKSFKEKKEEILPENEELLLVEDKPTLVATEIIGDKESDTEGDACDSKRTSGKFGNDSEDFQNKQLKRRSIKVEEEEDNQLLIHSIDSDEDDLPLAMEKIDKKELKEGDLEVGDKVKVKYGRGRQLKVYEAKVLKVAREMGEKKYYVHYAGWNMRYDEWIKKCAIVDTMTERNRAARKKKQILNAKAQNFLAQIQVKQERGRSSDPGPASKLTRKSSSSSTNSSVVSCSRTTRSDKNSLSTSPYSGGLVPRKRTRKKSGVSALTDTSQDSESDMDNMMMDGDDDEEMEEAAMEHNIHIKQEILSDDEEQKDNLQDSLNAMRDSMDTSIRDLNEDFKDESDELASDDRCPPILSSENDSVEPSIKTGRFICAKLDFNKVMMKEQVQLVDCCKGVAGKTVIREPTGKKTVAEMEVCELKRYLDVSDDEDMSEENSSPPKLQELASGKSEDFVDDKSSRICDEIKKPVDFSDISQKTISEVSELIVEENTIKNSEDLEEGDKGEFTTSNNQCADIQIKVDDPDGNKCLAEEENKIIDQKCELEDERKKLTDMINKTLTHDCNEDFVSDNLSSECSTKGKYGTDKSYAIEDVLLKESEDTLDAKLTSEESDKSLEDSLQFHALTKSEVQQSSTLNTCNLVVEDSENRALEEEEEEEGGGGGERAENNPQGSDKTSSVSTFSKDGTELQQDAEALNVEELKSLSAIIPVTKKEEHTDDASGLKGDNDTISSSGKESSITLSKRKTRRSDSFGFVQSPEVPVVRLDMKHVLPDLSVVSICASDCKSEQNSVICCPETLPHVQSQIPKNISNAEKKDETEHIHLVKEQENEDLQTSVIALAAAVATSVATAVPLPGPLVEAKVTESLSSTDESDVGKMPDLSSSMLSDSCCAVDDKLPKKSVEQKFVEEVFQNLEKRMKQEKLNSQNIYDKDLISSSSDSVISVSSIQNKSRNLSDAPGSSGDLKDCMSMDRDSTENDDTNAGSDKYNLKETVTTKAVESIKQYAPPETSADELDTLLIKDEGKVFKPSESSFAGSMTLDKVAEMFLESHLAAEAERGETSAPDSMMEATTSSRRESKKKRVKVSKQDKKFGNLDVDEDDIRFKETKGKSKKKTKFDYGDFEKFKDPEQKSRSKKLKKSKNKKRLSRLEDPCADISKKVDVKDEDNRDVFCEKVKKRDKKRRDDKKFNKEGKNDECFEIKSESSKKEKRKGKKKDKLSNEKRAEMMEKRTKKKKKMYCDDNFESDSEKESKYSDMDKHTSRLSRKEKRKEKKKIKPKDTSSSDDGVESKVLLTRDSRTEQNEALNNFVAQLTSSEVLHSDMKSDDPDMSFLLCEEKVPASPEGVNALPDDTSGSSSLEELNSSSDRTNSDVDKIESVGADPYPRADGMEVLDIINKRVSEASAVLDNTPPTTPSSTESLLSSSPSHEREHYSLNYPESTRSGRESGEGESDSLQCEPGGNEITDSEEYRAAATLAFAVCKSVPMKAKESSRSLLKRKIETEDLSPSKRRKKSKRLHSLSDVPKATSLGRHRSSLSRMKGDNFDDYDSCGANSVAGASSSPYHRSTSTMSTHYTPTLPHLNTGDNSSLTESRPSKFNFYVPLHDCKDADKRIAIIQDKLCELKRTYMALKAEVALIDRRRKKAKKKEKEAGSAVASSSAHVEEGQCSS